MSLAGHERVSANDRFQEVQCWDRIVDMPGKFLKRGAIVDVIKSQERTNAMQKRDGLSKHPVRFTVCGCPDPNCGGWHTIVTDRQVPTADECEVLLRTKPSKSGDPSA